MAVTTVVGKDIVLRVQGPGNRDADELLADAGVNRAKFALLEQFQQPLLGLRISQPRRMTSAYCSSESVEAG